MMPLAGAVVGNAELTGDYVSLDTFDDSEWVRARVPGTIVAGLVENEILPDPFHGDAITTMPGYKNSSGHFVNEEKPKGSPFLSPWWFRTAFTIAENDRGAGERFLRLTFEGLNPSGEIWLNGTCLARDADTRGAYRRHDFAVSKGLVWDGRNVLAVRVPPVSPRDLSFTFIDWNPVPPDDCAGIWQPVEWSIGGAGALEHEWVRADLCEDHTRAAVVPCVTVRNDGDDAINATVVFAFEGGRSEQPVEVEPHGRLVVAFDPSSHEGLEVRNPRLWWPYQLGDQPLYDGEFSLVVGEKTVDSVSTAFGINSITFEINEHGTREARVNGIAVPINGAAWCPDLMLREDGARDDIDLAYVRSMGLNLIRLEGTIPSKRFLDMCDQLGILVMAGWPCCNHFEHWDEWVESDMGVAAESLRSTLLRFRGHASFLVWCYGSDYAPPPTVEKRYLEVLDDYVPGLSRISSATSQETPTGPSGVKMTGPYEYVPPGYWYDTTMPGAADGFNTETCPSCALPAMDSVVEFMGHKRPDPTSLVWSLHAGGEPFRTTERLEEAVRARFGAGGIDQLIYRSQYLGYETWRAMFEAFRHNFPKSTGLIGWMLNSAWPSLIWQTYDVRHHATGSFFGVQAACSPLHAYYAYDTATVYLANDSGTQSVATVRVDAYDASGSAIWNAESSCTLDHTARKRIFEVPETVRAEANAVLVVSTATERASCSHAYWIAARMDVLVPADQSDWYYTPVEHHADLSFLFEMPRPTLDVNAKWEGTSIRLDLANTSEVPAMPLFCRVFNPASGEYHGPSVWDQNFIPLRPSEAISKRVQLLPRPDGVPTPVAAELHLDGPNFSTVVTVARDWT